ncbi:MAG: hypothetical protein JSV04_10160 [Candidatus Heimdallarchaeota archaeon]|nr:MAG: hypothetical protein JSV04_10160 [Candidatus Heimdallarchaeota archaeon]
MNFNQRINLNRKIWYSTCLLFSILFVLVMANTGLLTGSPLTRNDQSVPPVLLDDSLFQNAPRDAYAIINIKLENEILTIKVSYSGGCVKHEFSLISSSTFMESYPVQLNIVLSHDAHDDSCDAILIKILSYDLSPMRLAYQQAYLETSGSIVLNLEGFAETLTYQF